jgi:protein phosphatase PTC7
MALYAKRKPRPFPPPFLSPPSGSFSDPLSTHDQSRDRREKVNGTLIKGWTNGDDAAYASERFICANDGVGAWTTRPRGHAGLWARLVQHFWATEVEEEAARHAALGDSFQPDLLAYLQHAYEHTVDVTAAPDWQGTTTASAAQLHFRRSGNTSVPVVYCTSLGDSQIMVVRPKDRKILYKTAEQWHFFDCPRQLGTNSPDTPVDNAVSHAVDVQPGDVVIAMTDGVTDNLWDHEIVETVSSAIERWERGAGGKVMLTPGSDGDRTLGRSGGMRFAALELMEAARKIAADPFAESPFMERAVEEGVPMLGGKPDDISVVMALCLENK